MRREIDLNEISDGRLYGVNDMVKADCNDCKDCSSCCQGMGSSIVLDPLDCFRIIKGQSCTMEELLIDKFELNVVDQIVLPNLKMNPINERCNFLSEEGRCLIHNIRPGICRLFPLGRLYEGEGFSYFLQIHECRNKNRAKVKVKKWLDTPDIKRYEKYIYAWHECLKKLQKKIDENKGSEFANQVSMYVLKQFYFTPFDGEKDFYDQFFKRLEAIPFL